MDLDNMSAELDRLGELYALHIQTDALQERFKPYIELAKSITDTPICLINIIDAYHQWTIAGENGNTSVIPREQSICQDTIAQDSTYEIENLTKHDRYSNRPYVSGEPHFKYYCGVQLTTSGNNHVGSLCVLDQKSRNLSEKQKKQLQLIGDAIIEVIENESKRHTLSHELQKINEEIRKLNHDLRSPINGIVGLADVIQDKIDASEDAVKMLNSIRECGMTVLEQIDAVLKKQQNGSSSTQSESIDASSIKERLQSLYQPQAESKNITLNVVDKTNDVQISYLTLSSTVKIIGNLVSNALKFSSPGDEVQVELTLNGTDLHAIVSDDGVGMNPGQIEAFNNGNLVDRSTGTAGEQSFGIGLRHVQQLIQKLEGSIKARQGAESGTTFELSVPLH